MNEQRLAVLIGEGKVARADSLLYTVGLGSCVAIVLYDEGMRIGGLAHAMLPHPANGRRTTPPTRFASSAVAALVALMTDAGARAERLHARLAGGASMFEALLPDDGRRLGQRNVQAARDALAVAGIPLQGEDVGGAHGRSVFLRTADGTVTITSVAQPDVVL
jgi:chemotaxis protein CheD